jgi:hypothetical protein
MMEALFASLGTLLVVAGYMLVKRMARSNCAINSGCLKCTSPAIELAKKQTERLDEIWDKLKQVHPELQGAPPPTLIEVLHPATNEEKKSDNN